MPAGDRGGAASKKGRREQIHPPSRHIFGPVAITDKALTERFVVALGEAISGSVLDVASGPGILSAAVAKSARDVVAFDLTPQMLKKAAQRCAEAGIGNVTFREGNAAELPFADANFDAVVTRLSVHHFDR